MGKNKLDELENHPFQIRGGRNDQVPNAYGVRRKKVPESKSAKDESMKGAISKSIKKHGQEGTLKAVSQGGQRKQGEFG